MFAKAIHDILYIGVGERHVEGLRDREMCLCDCRSEPSLADNRIHSIFTECQIRIRCLCIFMEDIDSNDHVINIYITIQFLEKRHGIRMAFGLGGDEGDKREV